MDIWPLLLHNTNLVAKLFLCRCCLRYASVMREVGAVMQCIVYTRVVLNSFQIFAHDRVELLSCKLELFKIIFCQIHV